MHFPDSVPGDPVHAESAARYNAVNALLREHRIFHAAAPAPGCRAALTVDVCNTSGIEIPACTAVTFTDIIPGRANGASQLPGFAVAPAADAALPWGIAPAMIAPGAWASAVICGAVPAFFAAGSSDGQLTPVPGDRAVPSASGLLLRGDHGALVLAPGRRISGTDHPGVILLGGNDTAYSGSFAVSIVSVPEKKFHIAAGATVFPGLEWIPEAEVSFPALTLQATIRLVINFTRDDNGNATYTYEYRADDIDDDNCFVFDLARVGWEYKLTQLLTHGSITAPGWVL